MRMKRGQHPLTLFSFNSIKASDSRNSKKQFLWRQLQWNDWRHVMRNVKTFLPVSFQVREREAPKEAESKEEEKWCLQDWSIKCQMMQHLLSSLLLPLASKSKKRETWKKRSQPNHRVEKKGMTMETAFKRVEERQEMTRTSIADRKRGVKERQELLVLDKNSLVQETCHVLPSPWFPFDSRETNSMSFNGVFFASKCLSKCSSSCSSRQKYSLSSNCNCYSKRLWWMNISSYTWYVCDWTWQSSFFTKMQMTILLPPGKEESRGQREVSEKKRWLEAEWERIRLREGLLHQ